MIELFNSIRFEQLIWIFAIVSVLHELEEWNILKWYERNYRDLPPSTNLSIRLWILSYSLVIILFVWIVSVIPDKYISSILMMLFVSLTIQNGLQHLYWTVYFKEYAPGLIFSVIIGFPVYSLIIVRVVNEGYLPLWAIGIYLVLIIPGLIQTVKAKNTMTSIIKSIHLLGLRISNILSD